MVPIRQRILLLVLPLNIASAMTEVVRRYAGSSALAGFEIRVVFGRDWLTIEDYERNMLCYVNL